MASTKTITVTAPASPHTLTLAGHTHGRAPVEPIILVLIDDVGVELLSPYSAIHSEMGFSANMANPARALGRGVARCPTIEGIAAEGVTFLNAYTAPVCSPTRWSMLCGQYPRRTWIGAAVAQQRTGADGTLEFGDRRNEVTIFDILPDDVLGGFFGKLHGRTRTTEGGTEVAGINALLGCDESRLTFRNLNQDGEPTLTGGDEPGYRNFYLYTNETKVQRQGTHASTVIRQELQDWILNSTRGRFFAWCAFNACHTPLIDSVHSGLFPENPATTLPTGEGYSGTAYGTGPTDGTVDSWDATRAGLEHLDRELAQLKTALNNAGGIWDQSWVIIVGDNGSSDATLTAMAAGADSAEIGAPYSTHVVPNSLSKGQVYRAGTRVPFIVKGPQVKAGGRTCSAMVDTVDVWDFVREVTQGDRDLLIPDSRVVDSISFMPHLRTPLAETTSTRIRQWSYVDRFAPAGDPTTLTSGGSTLQPSPPNDPDTYTTHSWDRAVRGKASNGTTYCLVRKFDGVGGETEELFSYASDPYETTPLPLSGVGYTEAKAVMDEIAATDP